MCLCICMMYVHASLCVHVCECKCTYAMVYLHWSEDNLGVAPHLALSLRKDFLLFTAMCPT